MLCYQKIWQSGPWRPWRIFSKMRVSEMFSKVQTFLGSTDGGNVPISRLWYTAIAVIPAAGKRKDSLPYVGFRRYPWMLPFRHSIDFENRWR